MKENKILVIGTIFITLLFLYKKGKNEREEEALKMYIGKLVGESKKANNKGKTPQAEIKKPCCGGFGAGVGLYNFDADGLVLSDVDMTKVNASENAYEIANSLSKYHDAAMRSKPKDEIIMF